MGARAAAKEADASWFTAKRGCAAFWTTIWAWGAVPGSCSRGARCSDGEIRRRIQRRGGLVRGIVQRHGAQHPPFLGRRIALLTGGKLRLSGSRPRGVPFRPRAPYPDAAGTVPPTPRLKPGREIPEGDL